MSNNNNNYNFDNINNYNNISNFKDNKSNSSINSDIMYIRDWRKSLRSPPSYRVGNRTFRFHYHFIFMLLCAGTLLLLFLYIRPTSRISSYEIDNNWSKIIANNNIKVYNNSYPLSSSITNLNGMLTYKIGLIADMDTNSKIADTKNTWRSFLKKGYLNFGISTRSVITNQYIVDIEFNDLSENTIELQSNYAHKGRGMELSEFVTFNGRLLTFDDRTGIVYELKNDKSIPWLLLMDGNGISDKGFKSEWATVKDQLLYVGSMGKEWTTATGEFVNNDPMYVKTISVDGEVTHLNWIDNYKAIRSSIGISFPGYMIHESAVWSTIKQKWYFLPRRCSKEKYNETRDEHMGCNVLISADENFNNIQVTKLLDDFKPSQGFSSFKFIPGSDDNVIIALQTEEVDGKTSTYIVAFTIEGKIIMKQSKIETDLKYEGLEFL